MEEKNVKKIVDALERIFFAILISATLQTCGHTSMSGTNDRLDKIEIQLKRMADKP